MIYGMSERTGVVKLLGGEMVRMVGVVARAEVFQIFVAKKTWKVYPPKTNVTVKIHHLKMYFLLNMGSVECHVSFQGCRCFLLNYQAPNGNLVVCGPVLWDSSTGRDS